MGDACILLECVAMVIGVWHDSRMLTMMLGIWF